NEFDGVRFAPARYFASLGQAADDAQVHPAIVDEVLFDGLAELPFAGPLLARGERYRGLLPQAVVQVWILRAQRVLHKERSVLLTLAAEAHCVGQVEAGMYIQTELDVVADRCAHCLQLLQCRAHCDSRLQYVTLLRQAPAQELPAFGDVLAT